MIVLIFQQRFLLLNNPFVLPGREDLVARALIAGLRGDWPTVAHFAPPQIENMLRYILVQQGKLTSKLDLEGIEEEFSLGKLLCENDDIEGILGENLLFDLCGILVEKGETNLRNRMAHGLMSNSQMFDLPTVYLWFLLLKLCFIPFIPSVEPTRNKET